jgi:hypothetical protein
MYFTIKVLVTAMAVVGVSELSRRFSLMAAILASLPLTTILAFIWIYAESKNTAKISAMSYDIFWLVLPSLAFFLILPFLLRQDIKFPLALLISTTAMSALYAVMVLVMRWVR